MVIGGNRMSKLILSIALIIGTSILSSCHKMESSQPKVESIDTRGDLGDNAEEQPAEQPPAEEPPVEVPPAEEPPIEEPKVIKEFAYPDCNELNKLWRTRYHSKLKVNWPLKSFACVGPSKDRVFAEAAYILEHTVFRKHSLPAGVKLPPADMLSFVTDKYRELRIGPNQYPSTDVDNKIVYFYANIENENGFAAVGNLIHEARHADGLIYLHIPCWDGPYKGQHMCDIGLSDSFYEGGTHRVATLYLAWGVAASNWPKEWKDASRDLVKYVITNRINATAATRQAWIKKYLLTEW